MAISIRHGAVLGFNGQARDPVTHSDLLGNGKRVFSPSLMRFNSPDNFSPFGLGGINAFAYCGGDPVNFADPTGNVRIKKVPKRLTRERPRLLEPRDTDLPTAVVRPSVHGPASHSPSARFQQPASSGANPTTPVLPTTMSGPFSSEERRYTSSILQVAVLDQVSRPLLMPFRGSGIIPALIGFIGRQARGGVYIYSMDAIFTHYVPNYNTPAGRRFATQAQIAAHVAISIYQMRRGT
ncbi:RHS repeat-associated core domain-containing protein [Pseudomonas putida]|uniref:RHS repeat-associated core domain-containing protein n=1 Tax=Pseudomonas putida TaxID=303 RepID=UPI0034D53751